MVVTCVFHIYPGVLFFCFFLSLGIVSSDGLIESMYYVCSCDGMCLPLFRAFFCR